MYKIRLQGQSEKRSGYYYEFDLHSKPLGEGGMGVVYKGLRISEVTGARTVVAIKAMFDGLPVEVYERAEREASIRLRNDNLVEMLGFISEIEIDPYGKEKKKYYVVSEYLNGVVLSDLLEGQFKDCDGIEIPYAKQLYTEYVSNRVKTSVEIINRVLAGISALHDKGYIHRDIDPSNIMVTDDGTIKLIDFGIAKYVRSLGTIDKSLTMTGKFIGKAEYASPELVLGDVRNQGYATDIYAIGILFYRLLVGKLPFTGSKYEVLQMQLNGKVPVKNISHPAFRKIVKKATEKKIVDRYSTAAELRVEIDKAKNSKPNFFEEYWKQGTVVLLSSVACAALLFYYSNQKTDGPEPPEPPIAVDGPFIQPPSPVVRGFDEALAKLDSKDRSTAKEGLKLMKELADRDNDREAIRELGLTYCAYDKVLPTVLKERRRTLGLEKNTAEESVRYLARIKNYDEVSVYALFVLGYSYWYDQNYDDGYEVLTNALNRLEGSAEETFNGYSREELKKEISKYSDLCKKQLDNRK